MRTTLDIDAALLAAIAEIARREGRSRGAVASDLIRRALSLGSADVDGRLTRYGFRPFPSTDVRVTNAQVDELRDKLGI
jgi:hypothetical protein